MAQGWEGPGQREPRNQRYWSIAQRATRPVITMTVVSAVGLAMTGPQKGGRPQDRRSGGRSQPPRRPGGGHPAGRSYNRIIGSAARPVIAMLPLLAVQAYRANRADFGPMGACNCTPTCSTYAEAALEKYGNRRGLWLTAKRIWRCRFGGGGPDPT